MILLLIHLNVSNVNQVYILMEQSVQKESIQLTFQIVFFILLIQMNVCNAKKIIYSHQIKYNVN